MRLLDMNAEKYKESSANYYRWGSPVGFVESSVLNIAGREIPTVVCLPSSVGCRMGCAFCAMPKANNPMPLKAEFLWEIVLFSLRQAGDPSVFQISFMGQGEPLESLSEINKFCAELHSQYPKAVIGISTVGIAKGIDELLTHVWADRIKLQLSVHAILREKRMKLVPAEAEYPIEAALKAGKRFANKYNRKVCLAYVLINGINDTQEDAELLAEAAKGNSFYVKISELNECKNSRYKPSTRSQQQRFVEVLLSKGVEVHLFKSLGTEIGAGCGQTRLKDAVSLTYADSLSDSKYALIH